jgi:hypothetical protein
MNGSRNGIVDVVQVNAEIRVADPARRWFSLGRFRHRSKQIQHERIGFHLRFCTAQETRYLAVSIKQAQHKNVLLGTALVTAGADESNAVQGFMFPP